MQMLEEMVDVDSGLPGLLLDTVIDQALIRLTAAKAVLKWVAIQANKCWAECWATAQAIVRLTAAMAVDQVGSARSVGCC